MLMDSNRQASNWALTKSWSRSCLLLLYASTGRASLLTCQPAWQSLLQTTAPSQVPLIVHRISEFLFVSRTVFSVDCSSSSSLVVQDVESCSGEPSQQLDMWCHPSDLVSLMSPAYPKHRASQYQTIEMFCTQWAQLNLLQKLPAQPGNSVSASSVFLNLHYVLCGDFWLLQTPTADCSLFWAQSIPYTIWGNDEPTSCIWELPKKKKGETLWAVASLVITFMVLTL